MSTIPSVLTSAQQVLHSGFSRQDRAAATIAATGAEPDGVVEMIEAREEVRTGAALVRSYEQTTDALFSIVDPPTRRRGLDLYA